MPPQEDPPVDRVYPDDPDLLMRDLEEIPSVTVLPVKKPRNKPVASQPKAAPGDETASQAAKNEARHSPLPGLNS